MYLNALHNPFVYDDYHTVVANASLDHVGNLRAIVLHDVTRPVVNFSYAVDRALWGPKPFGFHVTSVLLHMLNVALLFQLARKAAGDGIAAWSAAALFAVHPMMTEAVGYVSGRSELLCAAWFLGALLCGRRWLLDGGARWGAATLACWFAGMASKETAAMFPFVFALYDVLLVAGPRLRRRLLHVHLPLVAVTVAAGIGRLAILRDEYGAGVAIHWRYALLDLDVTARYVWLMIRPVGQTIFHAVSLPGIADMRTFVAVAVLGLLVAIAWRLRNVQPAVSLGIAWCLALLVPSAVLILLDQGEPMTEHRVYAASLGLFIAAGRAIGWLDAWMLRARPAARPFAGAALGLVLAGFVVNTLARNSVWSDPVALWSESVDLAPDHYRPRLLLGEALVDSGRRREAIEQFQRAVSLRPSDPTGYVKLGQSLVDEGRFADARRNFSKALEIDPANAPARRSIASLDALERALGAHGR